MTRGFLIVIILLYRLIPCRIRRIWSFGSSTSHLALLAVRETETSASALAAFLPWVGIGEKPARFLAMGQHNVRIGPKPSWNGNDLNNTW